MIAVIFEAQPREGQQEAYLSIAAGKILSLSWWRDEESVARWRHFEQHRAAQRVGRERIFRDYRLRVAGVLRDYGMSDRAQVPGN